jgi:BirA family transcriptional regulator, biotin operon repressor / biotin---[acetyl-CoA-carboxylase] ligase
MNSVFEPQFEWLDRVDSTNSYCMRMANNGKPEGYAVASFYQEQGRGQRGNSWESEEGKNLTFSLLLRPTFIKVEEQFLLSKVIALSICNWIQLQGKIAAIKWPNDIYVGDKKVAGILIENSFSSPVLEVSVVGIGLNLNQTNFTSDIPNPTSMMLLTDIQFRPEIVLSELVASIQTRYHQLKHGRKEMLSDDYLKSLYKFQHYFNYSSSEGKFKAKIIGVQPTGKLILETDKGQQLSFGFKEVSFEL